MTVTELAPRDGVFNGAVLLDRSPLPEAAIPQPVTVPVRTLFVPEQRRLHFVTAEETIAFDKSSPLSPMVEEALKDPELVTTIFPMMAKNWWRAEHGVGTAEIFTYAYNDRGEDGVSVLEKAGFNISEERARRMVRAFIGHDLGMAFTRRTNEELNPLERVNLKQYKRVWGDMMRHPVLSAVKGRHHFDPFELDLMGCHQSLGRVRETYGRNPYREMTDPSDLPDEVEHLLFTKIDIVQAATSTKREYQDPKNAAGALRIIRDEFNGSDSSLDRYLAELAYARREFSLLATPEMEAFNDSLRGRERGGWSDKNSRYWDNPHALAGVFAHNKNKSAQSA